MIPRERWSGSAQSKMSAIGAAPGGSHKSRPPGQILAAHDVLENPCPTYGLDGRGRHCVVMLDGEQSAGSQPTPRQRHNGGYHGHSVGPAKDRVRWVMLC